MMKLQVGDIITVHNPLGPLPKYPVISIDGNMALTRFRVFHTKVWREKYVYEYGKRTSLVYENTYTVERPGVEF